MAEERLRFEKTGAGQFVLRLPAQLERDRVGAVWKTVTRRIQSLEANTLILDFEDVTGIDSAGIALVRYIEKLCAYRRMGLTNRNIPEAVKQFLLYTKSRSLPRYETGSPPRSGFVTRLGGWYWERMRAGRALVSFVGEVFSGFLSLVLHPGHFRIRETLYQLQVVGTDAMPLTFGLSFLMGMIMAFQAANTLTTMGAAIYVADVVTLSTTREMAPLLTAVIIAGRSGAAFAAEIGTMKINEEIDALTVMGFNLTRFLVLPRLIALALAGPLLTLLANAAGITGGALVAKVVLKLSVFNYFTEVQKILTDADLYTGLIKGFVFAFFIGLISCFRGIRTSEAPESVGVQTTSAVVSGILLLILADAFLTAIFQTYGW